MSKSIIRYCTAIILFLMPMLCFADMNMDPITAAGNKFAGILFGTLGTSICCIIIGGTFFIAKTGKISWDRFLYIGFCTAGFMGTPSIVYLIKSLMRPT